MNRYINAAENYVVFSGNNSFSFDCSALLGNGIVFVGEDEAGFWYERNPFEGRDRNVDSDLVNSIFAEVEQKYNEYQESTKPTEKEIKIIELRQKLAATDYKVLPDYDKPNEDVKVQRQVWRDEIRTLEK